MYPFLSTGTHGTFGDETKRIHNKHGRRKIRAFRRTIIYEYYCNESAGQMLATGGGARSTS